MWKNRLYLNIFFAILAVVLILPFLALAQGTTIPNPLGKTQDFPTLIKNISRAIMVIVLPLSVIGFIWAGFQYVVASASGDPTKAKKAKSILIYVIIGTVLIVGASALAGAIVNFVKNL